MWLVLCFEALNSSTPDIQVKLQSLYSQVCLGKIQFVNQTHPENGLLLAFSTSNCLSFVTCPLK